MHRLGVKNPALPLALATVLFFLFLSRESIWLDEAYSIAFSQLSWSALWTLVTSLETNMSLYHVLLKVWTGVFGDSEAAARSLSAVFAILSVAASYAVIRRLFDQNVAMVTGLLLASNAFLIHFAQEARGYTLLLFLATLSVYFFVSAFERRDMKHYFVLALVNASMLYAHFFGAFVILAQLIALPLALNPTVEWRRWSLTYLISGGLASPLVLSVAFSAGANPWAWAGPVSVRAVAGALNALSGGGLPIAMTLYFLYGAASIVYAWKRSTAPDGETFRWRYTFILLWFSVPILTLLSLSVVAPAFHDRYLITTLPALAAIGAIGTLVIRNGLVRWIAVGGLVVVSVFNVAQQYETQEKRNWRAASKLVLENSAPGDAVLFYSWMAKYPFEYYYRRAVDRDLLEERLICVWPSPFLPSSSEANVAAYIRLVTDYTEPDAAWLSLLSEEHERLWVILAMDDIEGMGMHSGPFIEQIAGRYLQSETFVLERIRIIRFDAANRSAASSQPSG